MGTCLEKSTYKIAALRANGIPAALNMVPVGEIHNILIHGSRL